MYAEAGLLYPYFQNFSQEAQQLGLEEFCHSQKSQSSMNDIFSSSSISGYELGEDDLFKGPEPILEEPIVGYDTILEPMAAAMSMISCGGGDVMPVEGLAIGEIESFRSEDLREVFYECEKAILENPSTETPTEISDIKLPVFTRVNYLLQAEEKKMVSDSQFQKSDSTECLSSLEWLGGNSVRPSFLDFPELDFETAYGMRRAYSEGDIKRLGSGKIGFSNPCPHQRPLVVGTCSSEDRLQKLSRYRNKKSRRNFGRKIKYACRKALADSQPRIRGRFAKTEESDICKE